MTFQKETGNYQICSVTVSLVLDLSLTTWTVYRFHVYGDPCPKLNTAHHIVSCFNFHSLKFIAVVQSIIQ